MAGLADYDYDFFDEYRDDVLTGLPSIEELVRLDDEVANNAVISRYEGPVDPVEWSQLEQHYDELFTDFITERIERMLDPESIVAKEGRFHAFRENIATLNRKLPTQRSARADVMTRPAERILLKRLRQLGFDPSRLDIEHVGRGGGLYLLELFVTAAQQQALADVDLLTALLDEADALGEIDKSGAMARLHEPVLMVPLWENQQEGFDRWLASGREGILEMATATGKTVAGIAAICDCCGILPEDPLHEPRTDDANVMVVAHSNAILKQWEQEIQDKLGLPSPAGRAGEEADRLSFSGGEVEFRTAAWLHPQYERDLAEEHDLVIYDEVHHYSNPEGFGAAVERPNYAAAMGLSATIGDEGGLKREKLTGLLGDVVYNYGIEDAQRHGIIPDFDWTVHPTPLDPYEREEWEDATESISDQFTKIQRSDRTREILKQLPVNFVELEDLGDFIRAHEAAGRVFDEDELPDSWSNLQAAIHSRTWIRHRSQPKIDDAVDLAKEYLEDPDEPVKIVLFAMSIDATDEIAERLQSVTDNVFRAHSELESSTRKNNERVQRNIDAFAKCDNGVLLSPQMLDEGIDVPDAEVGINVAGTKTKLQLVQRMGRVLRKHGDQRPDFHHFVAVPEENYLEGLDSKEYVQELNWIHELGETIGIQPDIQEAGVDAELLNRARQRGHELWARDLLDDLEVETVQGNVHLDQVLDGLTVEAIEILLDTVELDAERLVEDEWKVAMKRLRGSGALSVEGLQRIWWLFPLYRERPSELEELLESSLLELAEEDSQSNSTSVAEIEDSTADSSIAVSASQRDGGRSIRTGAESDAAELSSSGRQADSPGGMSSTSGKSFDDSTSGRSPSDDSPTRFTSEDSTFFDVLGVAQSPPYTYQPTQLGAAEHVSDELLDGVGPSGLLSSGYLHDRPLSSYLLDDEEPGYVLATESSSVSAGDQTVAGDTSYRAITAVSPRRTLCVVGNEPENSVVQIRHERVDDVEILDTGRALWSEQKLVIRAGEEELQVGDDTDADLSAVAEYVRAAAYDQRCLAADRLVETCGTVADEVGLDAVQRALARAESTYESAREWGRSCGLDPYRAESGLDFVRTCKRRTRELRRLKTARRLVSEARSTSDSDETEELYRSAKTDLESLLDTTADSDSPFHQDAEALLDEVQVELESPGDLDADESGPTREADSESDNAISTQDELVSELQRLTDDLDAVPTVEDVADRGNHETRKYYEQFDSWSAALQEAGLARRYLAEDLQRLAEDLDRAPTATEVNNRCHYGVPTYAEEFGSLASAIETANSSAADRADDVPRDGPSPVQESSETTDGNSATDETPNFEEQKGEVRQSGQEDDSTASDSTADSEGPDTELLTWQDIPDDARLPGPIALKVTEEQRTHSDSVDGRYSVVDLEGREFELKVWVKHDISVEWEVDSWYIVDAARGTVWESDGQTRRLLDSTADLEVTECGSGPPQ